MLLGVRFVAAAGQHDLAEVLAGFHAEPWLFSRASLAALPDIHIALGSRGIGGRRRGNVGGRAAASP